MDNQALLAVMEQGFGKLTTSLEESRAETRLRFETLERRFGSLEQRFGTLEQRFGTSEQRFETLEQRFETLERRFGTFEQRFGTFEQRTDDRFEALEGRIDQRFEHLEGEIRHAHVRIEALDGSVRLVAESVVRVDQKVDRLAVDMNRQLDEVRSLLRLSYGTLDKRVTALEDRCE